jgi:hypothetical protein
MSTRTGEGFQQEVTRHYNRTNGRVAERQVNVSKFVVRPSGLIQIDGSHRRE